MHYVSKFVLFLRAMGVIKVSNNKSDLQGHSRALVLLPLNKPLTIFYYTSMAIIIFLYRLGDIITYFPKFKEVT